MREGGAPGVGQVERPSRTAAAAVRLAGQPLLQPARADEGVEVPADGGGRDAQPRGELGRGLRAVLEEQGAHAVAGAPVVGGRRSPGTHYNAFHNTSVSYFDERATKGVLRPGASVSGLTLGERLRSARAGSALRLLP